MIYCDNGKSKRTFRIVFVLCFISVMAGASVVAAAEQDHDGSVYPQVKPANQNVKPLNSGTSQARSTRIVLLGTSAGPPIKRRRSQPATLLVVEDRPYLIDAGAGVVHQLKMAGYEPDQPRVVFITHNHLDHNAGLPAFIAESWFLGNVHLAGIDLDKIPPVKIYGPRGTGTVVDGALQSLSVSARIFNSGHVGAGKFKMPPAEFQAHDIGGVGFNHPRVVYKDDKVRVTAVENTHFHFAPGTPAFAAEDMSYSYRFDTPEGSVVFTGDTGPSSAVTKLANGADVLVSEVMDIEGIESDINKGLHGSMTQKAKRTLIWHMEKEHLSPEDVGKMAQAAGVKTVILHHMAPGGDEFTNTSRYTSGVSKYFSGPAILGRDLMEYDLYK